MSQKNAILVEETDRGMAADFDNILEIDPVDISDFRDIARRLEAEEACDHPAFCKHGHAFVLHAA